MSSLPFNFQYFYCDVFVCESLCIYPPCSIFLASWICRKLFINKFGEFPAIITSFHFLHIFLLSLISLSLLSLWDSHYDNIGAFAGVTHFSEAFSIVFILLFLCSLTESLYHSPSISLILLKFRSANLSMSSNFFFLISVILLFSSRTLFLKHLFMEMFFMKIWKNVL